MEQHRHYAIVEKAIRFIRENARKQPELAEIAAAVDLSPHHFQRVFSEWAGVSPKQFLKFISLGNAREALAAGNSTLEAAWQAGLSGNARLHDLFVSLQALTPGEFRKAGKGVTVTHAIIDTPFGPARVAATEKGIFRIAFTDAKHTSLEDFRKQLPEADWSEGRLESMNLLENFFEGKTEGGERIPLRIAGTPFQVQVWKALLEIPEGKMVSYGELAKQLGRPSAARAVGTAVGANPIAYLIPCHRVLRENGAPGGYRWGIDRKLAITGWEASQLNTAR